MGDEQKEDEALPDNLNGTLSIRVGKRSEIAKENFTFKISECYAVFEAKIKQYVSKHASDVTEHGDLRFKHSVRVKQSDFMKLDAENFKDAITKSYHTAATRRTFEGTNHVF